MPNQVLVVDDDRPTRELYRVALEMQGLQVESVADGAGAMKLLEAGLVPAVILIDWVMPGMSGSNFYNLVHQSDPWMRIPLLVISGSANDVPHDIPSLEKPFDLTLLYSKINQTVGYSLIR